MTTATWKVEVSWSAKAAGAFTIGTSTLGGTDGLAGSFGSTVLDDITEEVKSHSIRRGRSADFGPMSAGECLLTLNDFDGKYNPANASGPLYGSLVPMREVRVSARDRWGNEYERFRGYIRRIESNPARDKQEAQIEALDAFAWFARSRPTITATGPTTTGDAIAVILDAIGWTEPSKRALDRGDDIPDFSADGSRSALDLVSALLECECGTFFVSAGGVATYLDRHAYYRAPYTSVQSTISNVMLAALPSVDLERIVNRATCKRDADGAIEQTYEDAASILQYGTGQTANVTSPYLQDDAQALNLAGYLVWRGKDPVESIGTVTLVARDDATLAVMLARDLLDRVQITETAGGTDLDGYIEGIEEDVSEGGAFYRVAWRVAKRQAVAGTAFTIGLSALDGTDVVIY